MSTHHLILPRDLPELSADLVTSSSDPGARRLKQRIESCLRWLEGVSGESLELKYPAAEFGSGKQGNRISWVSPYMDRSEHRDSPRAYSSCIDGRDCGGAILPAFLMLGPTIFFALILAVFFMFTVLSRLATLFIDIFVYVIIKPDSAHTSICYISQVWW